MMEAAGETCKLCLKYIQGDSLAVLDEKLLGKLEFLQMDLDQSVEESNSVCNECEEKIEKAFDFKSCLVNVDANESEEIPNISDVPSTSTGESSAEKTKCHLCKNSVDKISVISLPKLLKDDSMMEVFQGHIPEVDLKDTENSMVCESCQKSLAIFSTLVASWSIANDWNDEDMKEDVDDFEVVHVKEENFDEFSDSNTNSSCAIEVSDSAKTSKKGKGKKVPSATKVKAEIDEISDSSESVSVTNKKVKKEETEEDEDAEMEDLQLKSEEVDIKDEDGINQQYELFSTVSAENHLPPISTSIFPSRIMKCQQCSYKTTKKGKFTRHLDSHKNPNEKNSLIYQCQDCPFKTKCMYVLNRHFMVHITKEERKKIKEQMPTVECRQCEFKTKDRHILKRHVLTHQPAEKRNKKVQKLRFACQQCPFTSVCEANLNKHMLLHVPEKELEKLKEKLLIYECGKCSYKDTSFRNFTSHLRKHKLEEEKIPIFECQICPYKTTSNSYFNRHSMNRHKSEQQHIQKELEAVKNQVNVPIFECQECRYRTTHCQRFNKHLRRHKVFDGQGKCNDETKNEGKTPAFECQECTYRTTSYWCFTNHLRKHVKDRQK